MPPLYIGGYQSYFTQSRDNFYRINPGLNYLQQSASTGNGDSGSTTAYSFTLTQTPIIPGYQQNPNRVSAAITDSAGNTYGGTSSSYNWMVLISAQGAAGTDGISPWYSLVDDGQGNLVDPNDTNASPIVRGSINYITGAVVIGVGNPQIGFQATIPTGNPINAQYVPYVASRPQSALFYQDQILMYPIPDQAYTVSFEAYQYPVEFPTSGYATLQPQLNEWWQLLAYGAADKIFTDAADFENASKFRPLLDEQMRLMQRRTIVQQTSERTASIYTEQSAFSQYPFGNLFSGF
jgi:hypothetical protein